MKACNACSRAIDDTATFCPHCGSAVTAGNFGAAPTGSAPGISWQPLTGSPGGHTVSAASPAPARVAPPPPLPNQAPGVAWGAPGTQAPPLQAPSVQIPPIPSHRPPSYGKDLKPLVPRTGTGIIPKLEQARDQIYNWMEAYCNARGIEPSILKSTPYSPSIWVECRAWTPDDPAKTSTDRCVLNIAIRGVPYHRYELLYDVTAGIGLHTKKITSVCELGQREIERLLDVLLTGDHDSLKDLELTRLRQAPWEFWRPKNKVVALDHSLIDILTLLNVGAFLSLLFTPVATVVAVVLAIGLWITALVIKTNRERRRWRFQNEGKPLQEPRILRRFDSWQALIFDLGKEATPVRQEILAELRKGANSGFNVATETIWYWGLDGKEERDQLVARFRRGIAFIQIYAYGDDMFVGWDAHMNEGTWVEKEIARGLHQGRLVSLRTVEAGRQGFTEYDLFDTNCLVEWVHGAVVKVVKRKMAYHKIDQEIDFTIIRGDRKIEEAQNNAAQQKPLHKRLLRVE